MPNWNPLSGRRTNSTTSLPEIFDEDSAAAYIVGITARTIRNWRTYRGLPFIRITARTIRIRRADLDDWLARHRVAMIQ
jgi:excisionase family DNA binding protein